jgi:NDP-sugar pyrophosphorylase family protein
MSDPSAKQPTIVFPMGGKGERMGAIEVPNKALVELPGAEMTLLEWSARVWGAGLERLVLLVPPEYQEIDDHVTAKCKNLPCTPVYSPDPFPKCGRTKALAGAIDGGCVPKDRPFVVHNPDDVVINYDGNFAAEVIQRHRQNAAAGCLATVVTTDSTVHTFTGFRISGDRVTGIEHNPVCDKKAHVGITLFEPALAEDVVAAARDESSSDFEQDVFADLASRSRLGCFLLPHDCWIAVNTPKDLSLFAKRFRAAP